MGVGLPELDTELVVDVEWLSSWMQGCVRVSACVCVCVCVYEPVCVRVRVRVRV